MVTKDGIREVFNNIVVEYPINFPTHQNQHYHTTRSIIEKLNQHFKDRELLVNGTVVKISGEDYKFYYQNDGRFDYKPY